MTPSLRVLADENFNNQILRAVRRTLPDADILRAQDIGLGGATDPEVLAWCAQEGRILLTHDAATIPRHAHNRVAAGQPMPGVLLIPSSLPIGAAIQAVELLITCGRNDELRDRVLYWGSVL